MATLGVTTNTDNELSQLVAGETHELRKITLRAGCGDLKRGTVLEMVDSYGTAWQQLEAASPADARAILAQDVTNDAAETQQAQAYFIGKYRYGDLIWPAGITTLNKYSAIIALQDKGIIIDEDVADVATTTTTSSTTTTTTA